MAIEISINNKAKLKQLEYILSYLHSYPDTLNKLKFRELIRPDELYEHYSEWLCLFFKFEGQEKEFFKSSWVPILRNSYDTFVDISKPEFPILSYQYFIFEPMYYYEVTMFKSIKDLMLFEDSGLDASQYFSDFIHKLYYKPLQDREIE